MGSIWGPYAIEWAGIGPSRKRLMKRMCLGPSGRILGLSMFWGSYRNLLFSFSIFLMGPDGTQGTGVLDGTYPNRTVFHIRTHTDI